MLVLGIETAGVLGSLFLLICTEKEHYGLFKDFQNGPIAMNWRWFAPLELFLTFAGCFGQKKLKFLYTGALRVT